MLLTCAILSAALFIEGVYVLAFVYKDKADVPKINKINETHTGRLRHEESSIAQDEPVNLLVLGLDEEGVRSDVVIIMNYNPAEGKLNILSVARDTRVFVNGRAMKINALVTKGGEGLIAEEIEELTALPVHYYITLEFKGFRKMVDVLGGVEMDVPSNMNYDDPEQNLHIHLKKGKQILDGDKAEQFVRYRKGNRSGQGYTDGDIGRIKAQQEFIKALVDQKLKLKYLSKVDDIYFILKKYMKTNIEIGDIRYYLKGFKNIKYSGVKTYTLPGDSKYINHVWYFIHDPDLTQKLISDNFFR